MEYVMQCEKCKKPAATIGKVKRKMACGGIMVNTVKSHECDVCGGKIIIVID